MTRIHRHSISVALDGQHPVASTLSVAAFLYLIVMQLAHAAQIIGMVRSAILPSYYVVDYSRLFFTSYYAAPVAVALENVPAQVLPLKRVIKWIRHFYFFLVNLKDWHAYVPCVT